MCYITLSTEILFNSVAYKSKLERKALKSSLYKFVLFFSIILFISADLNAIERKDFYSALSGNSLEQVELLIQKTEKEKASSTNKAFIGALYMKQAELLKVPGKKLNSFKKGNELLENEILKNPKNIEFRFLRLVIQKNAPNFLNYNNNIEEDKNLITDNFSTLNPVTQSNIISYIEKNGVINIEKLR